MSWTIRWELIVDLGWFGVGFVGDCGRLDGMFEGRGCVFHGLKLLFGD